jgi:hypothetical protein
MIEKVHQMTPESKRPEIDRDVAEQIEELLPTDKEKRKEQDRSIKEHLRGRVVVPAITVGRNGERRTFEAINPDRQRSKRAIKELGISNKEYKKRRKKEMAAILKELDRPAE